MTGEPPPPNFEAPPPLPPELPPPVPTPDAVAVAEPAPERYPFWSYADLLLFIGMALPSMLLGLAGVKLIELVFRLHPTLRVAELLPAQFLGYVLLFGALATLFRVQYARPFWRSLGWVEMRIPVVWATGSGCLLALFIVLLGVVIQTPNKSNPMTELLQDRTSVILLAIFGVTLGPLCEELAFRGLLQPLTVRSLGPIPGITLSALAFGVLHFQEYGNSWRHALLITVAGAGFGWMRHVTGSTRASTIMHASYNALFFLTLFTQQKVVK